MNFHIIIPARYQSLRLPGKVLLPLGNLSILERVYRQAIKACPQSIVIATDDERIAQHAINFGAKVVMTASHHLTGTDRIAEVVKKQGFNAQDIIVNVQGDEPFIEPILIQQVARCINNYVKVATLCWPIENLEQVQNPNVVKVVRNLDNHALYFSRSAIPANRDNPTSMLNLYRHIGLYSYQVDFLLEYISWPCCQLEQQEALEQLRILWYGHPIKVETAIIAPKPDINCWTDLEQARLLIA